MQQLTDLVLDLCTYCRQVQVQYCSESSSILKLIRFTKVNKSDVFLNVVDMKALNSFCHEWTVEV